MNRVYVYPVVGGRYVLVRGHLREWLRLAAIPAMWSPLRKGFYVRASRCSDLLAHLERAGFRVRIKGELDDIAVGTYRPSAAAPDVVRQIRPRRPPRVVKTSVDGQLALLELGEAS